MVGPGGVCSYLNFSFFGSFWSLCKVSAFRFLTAALPKNTGCLLRSLPADVVFDNASGYSFTCDLNDNIPAPWPSSSSMSSYSICAPGSL